MQVTRSGKLDAPRKSNEKWRGFVACNKYLVINIEFLFTVQILCTIGQNRWNASFTKTHKNMHFSRWLRVKRLN